MSQSIDLPVPVLEHPHWRVNIRPAKYERDAIPSLRECIRLIEKNAVRLRGWDYPHLGREENRGYGSNWIASWSEFMGHLEYWRLYQSSQFVHLFSVREAVEPKWREKLQSDTVSHLSHYEKKDWNSVPGFISVINTVYCVTEIVEFATRMTQAGIYHGNLELSIFVNGIKDFVLTTDWNRAWMNYYSASTDSIGNTWSVKIEPLISDSSERSLEIVIWMFERFGWLDPPLGVIRKDIDDFKSGRR